MQGSSLVDIEAHCLLGLTPFFSTVWRLTNKMFVLKLSDIAFVLKPKFDLIQNISVDYWKDFDISDINSNPSQLDL